MDIVITIVAGVMLGISYIVNRQISLTKFHPATLTFSYSLIGTLFSLPLLLYEAVFARTTFVWILAVISPLLFAFSNYAGFRAYQKLEASVVGLIGRLSLVVATLLSVLFLHEQMIFMSFLGLICILIGSLVILFEGKKVVWNEGVVFALIMTTCYGIVAVLDRRALDEFSPFTYVFFNNFIITLFLFPSQRLRRDALKLLQKQPVLSLASALCGLASWVGFLVAIRIGGLVRHYPIWESVALITTIAIGVVYLKESNKLYQKIVGTVLTIIGIILLS